MLTSLGLDVGVVPIELDCVGHSFHCYSSVMVTLDNTAVNETREEKLLTSRLDVGVVPIEVICVTIHSLYTITSLLGINVNF